MSYSFLYTFVKIGSNPDLFQKSGQILNSESESKSKYTGPIGIGCYKLPHLNRNG